MFDAHVRAEWTRACSFVLCGLAFILMAVVDPRDQTVVWLLGLAFAVVTLLAAASRLAGSRELYAALAGRHPAMAVRAIANLNRIPDSPAPHRSARLVVNVFGPLSGVAGVLMLVRLATL
jgi:hypothetical protein